jgi:hypothetical protein
VTIVQQASGTFTASGWVAALPAASSASNLVVLIVAGNTTVTTPSGWRTTTGTGGNQVNDMGHYLFDRQGVSITSITMASAAGVGTWWMAEIAGGVFVSTSGQNNVASSTTYNTASLTPSAGTRILVASIASLASAQQVRTVSGWTNSFVEQADVCQPSADYPMQGVAVLDNTVANGSTAYSTTTTYSIASPSRSALIAAYTTTAGAAAPARVRRVGKRR